MVIKLQRKKTLQDIQREKDKLKADKEKFHPHDVEELFSSTVTDNWLKFWKTNKKRFLPENLDVYDWVVFPLCKKEGPFYRCMIHDQVEIKIGPDKKPLNHFFRNIYFEEFISHCVYYHPQEHKQYIKEILFGK
jgi:hypothetical protein